MIVQFLFIAFLLLSFIINMHQQSRKSFSFILACFFIPVLIIHMVYLTDNESDFLTVLKPLNCGYYLTFCGVIILIAGAMLLHMYFMMYEDGENSAESRAILLKLQGNVKISEFYSFMNICDILWYFTYMYLSLSSLKNKKSPLTRICMDNQCIFKKNVTYWIY